MKRTATTDDVGLKEESPDVVYCITVIMYGFIAFTTTISAFLHFRISHPCFKMKVSRPLKRSFSLRGRYCPSPRESVKVIIYYTYYLDHGETIYKKQKHSLHFRHQSQKWPFRQIFGGKIDIKTKIRNVLHN